MQGARYLEQQRSAKRDEDLGTAGCWCWCWYDAVHSSLLLLGIRRTNRGREEQRASKQNGSEIGDELAALVDLAGKRERGFKSGFQGIVYLQGWCAMQVPPRKVKAEMCVGLRGKSGKKPAGAVHAPRS